MYVPSLELGLTHPFSHKRVCPPPRTKGWGGGPSPAAKGVGESQFQRLEKRLALCLLCGLYHILSTNMITVFLCLISTNHEQLTTFGKWHVVTVTSIQIYAISLNKWKGHLSIFSLSLTSTLHGSLRGESVN